MRIQLSKFGTTLVSRQSGKEAYMAFLPTLNEVKEDEAIEIDFADVVTLAPSWGDEFLTSICEKFGERVSYIHEESNPSVALTLKLLAVIKAQK